MNRQADSPQHVAIIMDGNGRWARSRGLPRAAGHRASIKVVRKIVEECASRDVEYLTLFAFSSENWRRPPDEVGMLMSLFLDALEREVADLHRNGVRLRFMGDRHLLGSALAQRMIDAEALTAGNGGLVLAVALAYGGRWDLTQACRSLAADAAAGKLAAAEIGEEEIAARLVFAGIPDPDLLIRTGGEQRISNFLLWNLAYTEMYFSEVLWPEFAPAHLDAAFKFFAVRERRFGRTSAQLSAQANAKVRILTATFLGAGLLISLFALPAWLTVWIFALVFTVGAWEWSGFAGLRNPLQRGAVTAALALLLAAGWRWSGTSGHLIWVLCAASLWWLAAFAWLVVAPGRHRPMLTLLCAIPVLIPAFIALARVLVAARGFARGPEMVLWMLLLVFAADIGAYFAGRSFGSHKMAPRVSPGKTWEGAAGGLVAVALVSLAGCLHFGLPPAAGVAFGCAVGVFSIIGDLTESMFKRAAGLKDSGNWLPGHGGVLDRIDSVTAAAPLYALGLFGSGVME